MFIPLFTIVLLISSAFASPSSKRINRSNGDVHQPDRFKDSSLGAITERHLTNAERLARGLPLNTPRRRASPVGAQASSPSPVLLKGNILIKNMDGSKVGFLTPSTFQGRYTFDYDQEGAMEISFMYTSSSSSQIEINVLNPPNPDFPLLGAVVSYYSNSDDIGPGSDNYLFLAGVSHTAPGQPAALGPNSVNHEFGIEMDQESAIWSYNPSTQAITMQWINSDGSAPKTAITIMGSMLDATGDVALLKARYNRPDVREIALSFVPT